MGNQLVEGWDKFWGTVSTPGMNTLMMIAGGAIMAWFLLKWIWAKSRGGGGGGGNVLQGFPWWPMAVGLLLTAPTLLIPMVLRLVQSIIKIVDQILTFAAQTLG